MDNTYYHYQQSRQNGCQQNIHHIPVQYNLNNERVLIGCVFEPDSFDFIDTAALRSRMGQGVLLENKWFVLIFVISKCNFTHLVVKWVVA